MNPVVIANAMITRLKVDSTLWLTSAWLAPLLGGSWSNRGPSASFVFPYLVITVGIEGDNAFQGLGGAYNATVAVYDEETGGLGRLETLVDRIIGDAVLASGNRATPTFGFHNHTLDLATNTLGSKSSKLTLAGCEIGPDNERVTRASLTFTGIVSSTAVNQ